MLSSTPTAVAAVLEQQRGVLQLCFLPSAAEFKKLRNIVVSVPIHLIHNPSTHGCGGSKSCKPDQGTKVAANRTHPCQARRVVLQQVSVSGSFLCFLPSRSPHPPCRDIFVHGAPAPACCLPWVCVCDKGDIGRDRIRQRQRHREREGNDG